jgi:hypothetical protein
MNARQGHQVVSAYPLGESVRSITSQPGESPIMDSLWHFAKSLEEESTAARYVHGLGPQASDLPGSGRAGKSGRGMMHPRGRINGRPFGNRQPARTSGRMPGLASTIGNPAASRALLRTRIAHVGRGPSALSRSGAPRGRIEMREQAESRGRGGSNVVFRLRGLATACGLGLAAIRS